MIRQHRIERVVCAERVDIQNTFSKPLPRSPELHELPLHRWLHTEYKVPYRSCITPRFGLCMGQRSKDKGKLRSYFGTRLCSPEPIQQRASHFNITLCFDRLPPGPDCTKCCEPA